MSEFRDLRVDVCSKIGGVDVLGVLVVLVGVAVCLKVGLVDVLEGCNVSPGRAFFLVFFVVLS